MISPRATSLCKLHELGLHSDSIMVMLVRIDSKIDRIEDELDSVASLGDKTQAFRLDERTWSLRPHLFTGVVPGLPLPSTKPPPHDILRNNLIVMVFPSRTVQARLEAV
ncbi:glycoside hydrolase family 61 protein [Moniliophthora roreri]|nr:glycoside hydrolase family 61 protein [Moniliophthora roreri]